MTVVILDDERNYYACGPDQTSAIDNAKRKLADVTGLQPAQIEHRIVYPATVVFKWKLGKSEWHHIMSVRVE